MPNPKAVAFDLDGLMFNTEELYEVVGRVMVERRGREYSPQLAQQMMGRPSSVALQIMIDHYDLDDTISELEQETDQVFAGILDDRLEPMPGLMELLQRLETAGIPKAVTTSSRRSFVENVLGKFQLQPRFEFLLTAEDVTEGKPNPEIYLTASKRFGISSAELMVLEDSEVGSRAAVASGAITISVPGEHSKHHNFPSSAVLAQSLADPVISNLLFAS